MNLTIDDCNYLLNTIDTYVRVDKNGGVRGAQNAANMTQKIQEYVKTLNEEEKEPDA